MALRLDDDRDSSNVAVRILRPHDGQGLAFMKVRKGASHDILNSGIIRTDIHRNWPSCSGQG